MAEKNLYTLCCSFMEDSYFPCQWQVLYSEADERIEIDLQLDLPNPQRIPVADLSGIKSQEDRVIYQIRGLLVTQALIDQANHYLFIYHFDDDQGVVVGDLAVIFRLLRQLVTKVQADWRHFIQDPQISRLAVQWDWQDFDLMVQSLKDQGRYSHEVVHLAKKLR